MHFLDFVYSIDNGLQSTLVGEKFSPKAPGTWNRRVGDELNVIWIQKHSVKSLCCINLGIHYAFLPTVGSNRAVKGDEIEHSECEIKLRLTSEIEKPDQWWETSTGVVLELVSLISSRGIALFDRYDLPTLRLLNLHAIESGKSTLLSSMTKVRAFLLLARIHNHFQETRKCIEAARMGIEVAGPAVGPKKVLRNLLRQLERA